jgi:hypothetical protein
MSCFQSGKLVKNRSLRRWRWLNANQSVSRIKNLREAGFLPQPRTKSRIIAEKAELRSRDRAAQLREKGIPFPTPSRKPSAF